MRHIGRAAGDSIDVPFRAGQCGRVGRRRRDRRV